MESITRNPAFKRLFADRGQVAVETALVLPLALILIFILLELCMLFNARQRLQLGTFRAARSYMVRHDPARARETLLAVLRPVTFNGKTGTRADVRVVETEGCVTARSVFLYKPLLPVFPLARMLAITLWEGDAAGPSLPNPENRLISLHADVELWE